MPSLSAAINQVRAFIAQYWKTEMVGGIMDKFRIFKKPTSNVYYIIYHSIVLSTMNSTKEKQTFTNNILITLHERKTFD